MTATKQPDRPPAPGIIPVALARLDGIARRDRLADEGDSLAAEGSRRIVAQIASVE